MNPFIRVVIASSIALSATGVLQAQTTPPPPPRTPPQMPAQPRMQMQTQPSMQHPMVGGEAMHPDRDIVTNAMTSADHTTLIAAVNAAGLGETLKGSGPFTVFAPTNAAFTQLPDGTVESLLEPANKTQLSSVLTYHVVAERLDAATLMSRIQAGNGTAVLKTVNGGELRAMMNGPRNIQVKDAKGHIANISTYDVMQSNGVIMVIDRVLMPE